MPSRPSSGAVAPRNAAAIPNPATEPAAQPESPATPARALGPKQRRPRIVVRGETSPAAGSVSPPTVLALEYPIQPGKVQAPPLRDDTLARDRLLDWLSVKVHSRVVLLVAEAGYGKTTLLADFSRRTRVRVLWYRLDRGDRDWVGFIAHLVAAVRVHIPTFGSATAGLLRETATSMPSIDAVLDTFLRELSGLPNDPTALVFDDVHFVDDSPDVKQILRELLARGPERLSFIFSSRREPPVRLARLRALGEVAELHTNDLRFDTAETERLFRDSFELQLEPSVLAELRRRTEGWAASLQLVRTAIHDRSPSQVRAFISSLSGAEGHLYDYLAEEVIGDLPPDLQEFLMRTSVLETVDVRLGAIASATTETEARQHIEDAVARGLLGKGAHVRDSARAHPLVRQFLSARLTRSIEEEGTRAIHDRVAVAAEPIDWQISARHYASAGRDRDARRVVAEAIERILGTGAYVAAREILTSLPDADSGNVAALVIESRLAQQRAAIEEALTLAEQALASEPSSTAVLLTLASARMLAGDVPGAMEAARRLERSGHEYVVSLGRATAATLATSVDGSLDAAEQELVDLIATLEPHGATHWLGVALLNWSLIQSAKGQFHLAINSAEQAIAYLLATSAGLELVSARAAYACALAYQGQITAARAEIRAVLEEAPAGQALELAADIAQMEALVGESEHAWPLVTAVEARLPAAATRGEQVRLARALLNIQDGALDHAREDLDGLQHGVHGQVVAFEAQRLLTEGLLMALQVCEEVPGPVIEGTRLATLQGASFWANFGKTVSALADRSRDPSQGLLWTLEAMPSVVSSLAELVLESISRLNPYALEEVGLEAERRPWRWRASVRRALRDAGPAEAWVLARLLERIGEPDDVAVLRDVARRSGRGEGSRLGLSLARRLAPRVFVEDLGRLQIRIGPRVVDGSEIRRKVLALLCYLLTRPNFSSTRDEVIDNLWPEHDPGSALNSLNQTVYFLRRVFEPRFADETSPGYLGQDGETIWLDPDLIDSRSRRCLQIIRSMPQDPSPEGAVELAAEYRGRFALDFAYEEWCAAYRDALHASYLRVVEHAVRLDLDTGHFDRGTFIAERAAEIDQDSEDIQAALVRLYRLSGAHAAAAEQYTHYSNVLRDLGVEPPDFSDV